jgi:hypothetical protein
MLNELKQNESSKRKMMLHKRFKEGKQYNLNEKNAKIKRTSRHLPFNSK